LEANRVIVDKCRLAGGEPFGFDIFSVDMTPGRIVPHHQFTT